MSHYFIVFFVCLCLSFQMIHSSSPLVVVITGASTGIGKAIAQEFAKDSNFKVWATMRDPSKWDLTPIDNVVTASLDVTSDDSVNAFMEDILRKEGKIDILINNAGIGIVGALENVHIDEAKNVFEVNVWGAVRMLQAALPSMRRRRSGQIINISSVAGLRGSPGLEYYCGSKFALEGIMEGLRYSLAAYNISVTNVNPGPVKTPIGDKLLEGMGSRKVEDANDHNYMDIVSVRLQTNLGRSIIDHGQPSDEVAKLVVNLVHIKQQAKVITDIPFNTGTNTYSQGLLEQIRVNPTGWGGFYTSMLTSMPAIPTEPDHKDEL